MEAGYEVPLPRADRIGPGWQDGALCDERGDLSLEQFEAVMRQQIRLYTQVRPLRDTTSISRGFSSIQRDLTSMI